MAHLGLSREEAVRLARESFCQNGQSFLESMMIPEFGFEYPLLRIARPDLLDRLRTLDRPVVIASAHLGAWELLAGPSGDMAKIRPMLTVVRRYKNPVLEEVTTRLRSSRGLQVLGHRDAALSVLRVLRKNGIAAFLVDHNTGHDEAVFLPFLGEEAAVNKGPALLAVRSHAQIWPMFLLRDGENYVLHMDDPMDTALLEGDTDSKILATARFYTEAVERAVRFTPEQWFWMHNRWKTKNN